MSDIQRFGKSSGRRIKDDNTVINMADFLVRSTNEFNENRTAQRFPQLTLNAGLPLSERRDYLQTTNNGSITQTDGEYVVQAATDTDSTAYLRTRQRAYYISGGVIEGGLGIRIPTQPTGTAQKRWGFIEDENGVYFSWDSDGLHVNVLSGGSLTQIDQADWNLDTMDGNGPSGSTLDPAIGHVYQVRYVYYGYGPIVFEVGIETNAGWKIIPVHYELVDESISIEQPNLPLGIECDSGDSGTVQEIYVGGRQINSSLRDDSIARTVGARRIGQSIGTTIVPLISFKHKTGFESIFLTLTSIEVLTTDDLILKIRRNASLTGANFTYAGNYTESERATQWDVSATALTGGETMWEGFAVGGQGNKSSGTNADVPQRPISELDTITLCARTVSGSATAYTIFKVDENW